MSEEDRIFYDRCEKPGQYSDIEAYVSDICRWLTLSSWHYTEEAARRTVKMPNNPQWIREAYERNDPISDIGVEVGYCCG